MQMENTVHYLLNDLWTDEAQTKCQHTKLPHVHDKDSTWIGGKSSSWAKIIVWCMFTASDSFLIKVKNRDAYQLIFAIVKLCIKLCDSKTMF